MKLSTIKTGATVALGNAKLVLKKHAPDILMATGVVSIVGGTVLACRATLKATEVLEDHEEMMYDIFDAIELSESTGASYTDEDEKKDKFTAYTHTTLSIAKLYTPSVILMTTGITCILSAHGIMKKRYVALSTAYSTLQEAFSNYRDRVRKKYGAEEERRIYLGADEVAKTGEVDESTGEYEEKLVFKGLDGYTPSPYAVFFDETSTEWKRNASYNKSFLISTQNWANDQLRRKGHLFLNEVYDALGFPETSMGSLVGWILGEGDDFVDFGMFDVEVPVYGEKKRDFVNGYEMSILLDFNVTGVIYDKI